MKHPIFIIIVISNERSAQIYFLLLLNVMEIIFGMLAGVIPTGLASSASSTSQPEWIRASRAPSLPSSHLRRTSCQNVKQGLLCPEKFAQPATTTSEKSRSRFLGRTVCRGQPRDLGVLVERREELTGRASPPVCGSRAKGELCVRGQ